jgi:GGDEF domain-containing protein
MLPLLEELRRSIEESRFTIRGENRPSHKPPRNARPAGGKEWLGITVSIGVARRSPLRPSPEAVVKAADNALYRAKQLGRNRVEPERSRNRLESYAKRFTWQQRKGEEWQEDDTRSHPQ